MAEEDLDIEWLLQTLAAPLNRICVVGDDKGTEAALKIVIKPEQ